MVANLKPQFSKARIGTYDVYVIKYKHKTQDKGHRIVFNLKSQFSKPRVRTLEVYSNTRLKVKEKY